jgi:serine/threonine protein kinase
MYPVVLWKKCFAPRTEHCLLDTALQVTQELAEALDYAHAKGIVHRDVKPSNIIVAADGHPKITDFGIAKLNALDFPQTGLTLGTPAYMSPEQLRGDPVDGRSDLFSLGIILYQLLPDIDIPGQQHPYHFVQRTQSRSGSRSGPQLRTPSRARPRDHSRDGQGPRAAISDRKEMVLHLQSIRENIIPLTEITEATKRTGTALSLSKVRWGSETVVPAESLIRNQTRFLTASRGNK